MLSNAFDRQFGSHMEFTEDLVQEMTSSVSYVDKLIHVMMVGVSAAYYIGWYFELWTDDGADRHVEAIVDVDDTTVLSTLQNAPVQLDANASLITGDLDDPLGSRSVGSGFRIVQLSPGQHAVRIKHRIISSSGSSFLENAIVVTYRM